MNEGIIHSPFKTNTFCEILVKNKLWQSHYLCSNNKINEHEKPFQGLESAIRLDSEASK